MNLNKRTINFIGHLHHKNVIGAKLMNSDFLNIEINGQSDDFVVYTDSFIQHKHNRVMYGPQIDLRVAANIPGPVNFLSNRVAECAKNININSNRICLPFPVDINLFCPADKIGNPVFYYKKRNKDQFENLQKYFNQIDNFKYFDYEETYDENIYLKAISEAPYCIWFGCHESQGFALQECLSCNTQVFVIDCNSLEDEITKAGNRYRHEDYNTKATSAPYFDETCGLISNIENYEADFENFRKNLDSYSPREYILNNLSAEVLTHKRLNHINEYI